MKKILIGASTAIIITSLAYYPSYRAPKAHSIIEHHIAQLKQSLEANKIGTIEISKHTTNRSNSSLVIEWKFNLSPIETITATSNINIDLGSTPSTQGYKTITSTTTSKNINTFLENQGHADGLTFDCVTTPASQGHETNCTTNALSLKNQNQHNQTIKHIDITEMIFNININDQDGTLLTKSTAPSFAIHGENDSPLALIQGAHCQMNTPYDPTAGIAQTIDTLIGNVIIDGNTQNSCLIDLMQFTPPNTKNIDKIAIQNISLTGAATTTNGITNGDIKIAIEDIQGIPDPYNIKSATYEATFNNIDSATLADINKMNLQSHKILSPVNDSINSSNTDAINTDVDSIKNHIITILSKGPSVDANFKLEQPNNKTLKIQSSATFNATTQEELKTSFEPLLNLTANHQMTVLNFVLDNIVFKLNATADETVIQAMASLATLFSPNTAAMTKEQQEKATTQGITMLEMLGILTRNDTVFSTELSVDDKGIFLNGKDVAPMLGLSPRTQQP